MAVGGVVVGLSLGRRTGGQPGGLQGGAEREGMTPLLDADLGVLEALAFVVDDLDHEIALPDRVDPGGGFGAPGIVGGRARRR